MPARQVVVVKRTTSKTRTRKPSGSSSSNSSGRGRRGNPNRCPACGRFI